MKKIMSAVFLKFYIFCLWCTERVTGHKFVLSGDTCKALTLGMLLYECIQSFTLKIEMGWNRLSIIKWQQTLKDGVQ